MPRLGTHFPPESVKFLAKLYEALFAVWQEEGGGLFVHYAGIAPADRNEPGPEPNYYQSENFGIKDCKLKHSPRPWNTAPSWR